MCDAAILPSLLGARLAYHEDRVVHVLATPVPLLGTSVGAFEAATSAYPLASIEEAIRALGRALIRQEPTNPEN